MQSKIYNQEGKEVGAVILPDRLFGVRWNPDLVHQVVVSLGANARAPIAHAKGRGEVRGGGKKPWRQKGTGRARHGSIRSPLWKGGGVTFGPSKERRFGKKINRRMKAQALASVLSQKLKDNEVLFVDSLSLPGAKTKEARAVLNSLSRVSGFEHLATRKTNAAILALPRKDAPVLRGFRNFNSIALRETKSLNPLELLRYKYILLANPQESVEILGRRVGAV